MGSVTVVVGAMINSYDCHDQYIGFFAAMGVTDGAVLPAGSLTGQGSSLTE